MIEGIIGTAFALALRILMGHLALKFTTLEEWLVWFTGFVIVVASVTGVIMLVKLIREIVTLWPRSGKDAQRERRDPRE